jgi:hypothetical protein
MLLGNAKKASGAVGGTPPDRATFSRHLPWAPAGGRPILSWDFDVEIDRRSRGAV